MFILPPGAFIALGFILAGVNLLNLRLKAKKEAKAALVTDESVVAN